MDRIAVSVAKLSVKRQLGTKVRSWDASLQQQLKRQALPDSNLKRIIYPPTKWQALVQKEGALGVVDATDMDLRLHSLVNRVMLERNAASHLNDAVRKF